MQRTVEIDLNRSQLWFYDTTIHDALFIGGVGSGKTFVGARKALKRVIKEPKALGFIGANTSKQLNTSTLPEFWNACSEIGWKEGRDYVVNKRPPADEWGWHKKGIVTRYTGHKGIVSFKNGAQIVIGSLFKYEYIDGLTLDWAWLDETKDTKKEAFRTVQERVRGKNTEHRQVFITTTPNGFDWLHEHFDSEPNEKGKEHLKLVRDFRVASTRANVKHVGQEYIDYLESILDPRMAEQQLEGLWRDIFTGKAYSPFDRDIHVVKEEMAIDRALPVWLCCDFNVTPMSWVVAQPKRYSGHPLFQDVVLRAIDEIVINKTTTLETVEEFLGRYEEYGFKNDTDLIMATEVYGDSSNKSHHTTAKRSDYQIMYDLGLKDQFILSKNPFQVDRVASVNGKLLNKAKKVGVQINKKCKTLIRDFSRVGWKEGTRKLDDSNPKLTHASDAFGYCIYRVWPVDRRKFKSVNTAGY